MEQVGDYSKQRVYYSFAGGVGETDEYHLMSNQVFRVLPIVPK